MEKDPHQTQSLLQPEEEEKRPAGEEYKQDNMSAYNVRQDDFFYKIKELNPQKL